MNKENLNKSSNPLGDLNVFVTEDGSISLFSDFYSENFHNKQGAISEAIFKFLNPIQINNYNEDTYINILDVCVGIGYNSACIFEAINSSSKKLNWWGLEIDKRPLSIALDNEHFRKTWSSQTLNDLTSINNQGYWARKSSKGKILWGDARKTINVLPNSLRFDLILLDPFSPRKCPQLWSEEFLNKLVNKLKLKGKLTTYSRSAAIRGSLRRSGLELMSIIPQVKTDKNWSDGTLGILLGEEKVRSIPSSGPFKELNKMEEEHLLTKAAIPYRDLSGEDTVELILKRRKSEQENCFFENTIKWKKRWNSLQAD